MGERVRKAKAYFLIQAGLGGDQNLGRDAEAILEHLLGDNCHGEIRVTLIDQSEEIAMEILIFLLLKVTIFFGKVTRM